MKLSYDPRCNIAYITLCDNAGKVETLRVSNALRVDLGPDGEIFGIALLNARQQLQNILTIVNEATGGSLGMPLEW